jgi:amidophosphoribosyltransferase
MSRWIKPSFGLETDGAKRRCRVSSIGAGADRLHEECGVFGIYGADDAAETTYLGMYALQHRGQESAGILASDGRTMRCHKAMGLVTEVFTAETLAGLEGRLAIGHNRYSTTGSTKVENAQPLVVDHRYGKRGIAHNGNLVNAFELRREMERNGSIFQTTSDSEIFLHLIARSKGATFEDRVIDTLKQVKGAYSALLMTEKELVGIRDPRGFRPLCIGRRGDAVILASETCAFDIVEATFEREVDPGEMIVINREGLHSYQLESESPRAHCIFELIYFSRPDSRVFGTNVDKARRAFGRRLAEEHPADADIVIAVPDSSNSAALGYAERSGIPFELGLIRNHYIGRTFIDPVQKLRDRAVSVKFNPVRGILRNKRIVVVDDSIVRGTTSRKLVKLLRRGGAKEIHFRVSSPPIKFPCCYGIDTPTRSELIASSHSVDEIAKYLRVDSLGYLSLEGMLTCVKAPEDHCCACFSGDYSIPFEGEPDKLILSRGLGT